MPNIIVYCTHTCPYCNMAERLLNGKHVEFTKIRVDLYPELRAEMIQRSGRCTVPQIFIGNTHVGGFDDLSAMDKRGELDLLLKHA